MNGYQLLSQLRNLDVKVWVDGDRLRLKAPAGKLTPELKKTLSENKEELLRILRQDDKPEEITYQHEELFLSSQQKRLWLLDRIFPAHPCANIVFAVSIVGPINLEVLGRSLKTVSQRHEILRTHFIMEKGLPSPVIEEKGRITFKIVKLQTLPVEERERVFNENIHEEYARAFDISKGPLFRCRWLNYSDREHVLIFSLHAVIADQRSGLSIIKEFSEVYDAFSKEESPNLPEPSQYSAFVTWQKAWLESPESHHQLSFWKQVLENNALVLDLPSRKTRPTVQTFLTTRFSFKLAPKLAQALIRFSTTGPFKLEAVLATSFAALFQRYTGRLNLLLGIETDPRKKSGREGAIGPYSDVHPISFDFTEHISFKSLISQTETSLHDIHGHALLPSELLLEESVQALDLSRHPLTQVAFSFSEEKKEQIAAGDLTICSKEVVPSGSYHDLVVEMRRNDDQIMGFIDFNTGLFEVSEIDNLMTHFIVMLEALIENIELPIVQSPILPEVEKSQILLGWNNSEQVFTESHSLRILIEGHAANHPEAIALLMGNHELSYGELNLAANKLASYLKSLGIQDNDFVGILMENSFDLVICLLGVMKAGAVVVALEAGYPKERLSYILKDSSPKLLISQENLLNHLPDPRPSTLCLEQTRSVLEMESSANPEEDPDPQNGLYLAYSSGAKGSPTGVMVNHWAVSDRLIWMKHHCGLTSSDRFLHQSRLGFYASAWQLYLPLSMGASVALLETSEQKAKVPMTSLIERHGITVLLVFSSLVKELLKQPKSHGTNILNKVLCGGDPVSLETQSKFFDLFPEVDLFNFYGSIETSFLAASWRCSKEDMHQPAPIGKPVANTTLFILDKYLNPAPIGVPGELYVGGAGLVQGYHNQPQLTVEKFISNPFSQSPSRLYRTGDMARWLDNGNVQLLGRADHRVDFQGYRVEPGEIESALRSHEMVDHAVVLLRDFSEEQQGLVAYFTSEQADYPDIDELRHHLQLKLPEYMIPSAFVSLSTFPKTSLGEMDRKALPLPSKEDDDNLFPHSLSEIERVIARVWRSVLNLKQIYIHENFFDIGGDSFLMIRVFEQLPNLIKEELTLLDLFKYPTIHGLDLYVENKEGRRHTFSDNDQARKEILQLRDSYKELHGLNIAIIGMTGRYPGANTVGDFWSNICQGKETVSFFSRDELESVGVDPELLDDSDYVRAMGIIDGIKDFDAAFFEFTPREAQITDPQQRLFLEMAWEVMEAAGYVPEKCDDVVGVYGGVGETHYHDHHINANPRIAEAVGELAIIIGNDKDNLCSRVSYKLGLTGPAMLIQSACSTALVAVHIASQALQNGDCGMAIVGGISLRKLSKTGYMFEEGLLLPPDGHGRAFDARAQGTVHGQGGGLFLLKKLDDAILDGDHIHAILRGSAVNNDGSLKVGYSAYSVEGQTKVIEAALNSAGVLPTEIGFLETSSTASPMGDPIEIEAITKAYNKWTDEKQFCPIGALKPNVGHMDIGSSAGALMKTICALEHKLIPPLIHFEQPNPKINFEESPVFVNTALTAWEKKDTPRRAGVSAFGLGGTNAHLILEEPPHLNVKEKPSPWQILFLSAKTPNALEKSTDRLVTHFKKHPNLDLANVAYSLQVGRRDFKFRRIVVCQNLHEAVLELGERNPRCVFTAVNETRERPVAFLFPGQGAQYTNMARQLYQVDPTYREGVDRCWSIIEGKFPDLYQGLSEKDRHARTEKIHKTYLTQFSLFVVEYAMAKMLMTWGIQPQAMIGNSTGEYVAACISGVFSLEDALSLLVARGRLMQTLPPGDLVAIELSEEHTLPFLNEELSLAGVESPGSCIVSGSERAIANMTTKLRKSGVDYRRLFAPHAFHSYMVDPIVPQFAKILSEVNLHKPSIPFISSSTGTWITDEEATDPNYWARQQRQTVRFAQGVDVLFQEPERVLLEVGPDKTLSTPAIKSLAKTREHTVLATMRHPQEEVSDIQHLLTTLGRLWLAGVPIDWQSFHKGSRRTRTPLPTYPFEREHHWIDAPKKIWTSDSPYLESDEYLDDPEPQLDAHFRPNVSTEFIAPNNDVQERIAAAWQETLGLKEIGIHDDFFELGGSSLIAVRLLNQLGKSFGVPLASHIMLQKRTIAALAELITENMADPGGAEASDSPLIEIQKGNSRNLKLFMVHPIGGEVYFYRDIGHFMGAAQPVYGFQAPSLVGNREAFTDIVEQATFYKEELLRFQPKGPYLIGGASYGGNVAYEMGQQLIREGYQVPLLVVVDSPAPGQMPSKFTDSAAILFYLFGDKIPISVDAMRDLDPQEQLDYVFEQARLANRLNILPPTLGLPMFNTWMGHQTAMHSYKPDPYPGKVLFFRPTEMMKVNPPKMYLPWIDMVHGGIEIHQVGGNHITMNYGEHAKQMAWHLKKALRAL